MVGKCVNPFCNRPFRYLSQGKLFLVEFPQRVTEVGRRIPGQSERFWLCEECACSMTVAVRREFDFVSVRIINLSPDGATKWEFVPQRQAVSELPAIRPAV